MRCTYCDKPVGASRVLITDESDTREAHPDCYEQKAAQPHPDPAIESDVQAPMQLDNPQVS